MSEAATTRDSGPCPLLGDLLAGPDVPLIHLRKRAADEIIKLRRFIADMLEERDNP